MLRLERSEEPPVLYSAAHSCLDTTYFSRSLSLPTLNIKRQPPNFVAFALISWLHAKLKVFQIAWWLLLSTLLDCILHFSTIGAIIYEKKVLFMWLECEKHNHWESYFILYAFKKWVSLNLRSSFFENGRYRLKVFHKILLLYASFGWYFDQLAMRLWKWMQKSDWIIMMFQDVL